MQDTLLSPGDRTRNMLLSLPPGTSQFELEAVFRPLPQPWDICNNKGTVFLEAQRRYPHLDLGELREGFFKKVK